MTKTLTYTATRITAWLAAILAFTCMLTITNTPQAQAAKTVSHPKVGTIQGWYDPAPYRDYRGYFRPAAIEGGNCVVVQRKTAAGVWTGAIDRGGEHCNPRAWVFWAITNDARVSDTIAIRLYVLDGVNTGSYVVLCSTKSSCLSMR